MYVPNDNITMYIILLLKYVLIEEMKLFGCVDVLNVTFTNKLMSTRVPTSMTLDVKIPIQI